MSILLYIILTPPNVYKFKHSTCCPRPRTHMMDRANLLMKTSFRKLHPSVQHFNMKTSYTCRKFLHFPKVQKNFHQSGFDIHPHFIRLYFLYIYIIIHENIFTHNLLRMDWFSFSILCNIICCSIALCHLALASDRTDTPSLFSPFPLWWGMEEFRPSWSMVDG